jgi:hypothetical protein
MKMTVHMGEAEMFYRKGDAEAIAKLLDLPGRGNCYQGTIQRLSLRPGKSIPEGPNPWVESRNLTETFEIQEEPRECNS